MAGDHLRTGHRRPGRRLLLVALVALVVGVAAGVGVSALFLEATDDDAAPVASGPESPGVAQAVPERGPITLAFVGDVNAEGQLAERLDGDPTGFVGPFAEVLRGADLAVANVEAAITDTVDAPLDKDPAFRVPPSILDALRAGGIDVVSVANDHGIDHGADGLVETLEVKRSQAASSGAGGMLIGVGEDEDDAYAPFVRDVGGHRVAVIAATQVINGEFIADWTAQPDAPGLASAKRVDRLVEAVEEARSSADTVVVYLHWGADGDECPNGTQQELAVALSEAGADVIVGTHAHRVQGAGRLGDTFVGYGVGNFLTSAADPVAAATGALLVEVDGREIVGHEWVPGEIVDRVPQPLEGDAAATAIAEWEALRECAGLGP